MSPAPEMGARLAAARPSTQVAAGFAQSTADAAARRAAPPEEPGRAIFRADVLRGLTRRPRLLPPKYFYDEAGSRLFDRICELPEYYPSRAELSILEEKAGEMAAEFPPATALVEFGSGSSVKTRRLLAHAPHLSVYVPVDISCAHLRLSCRRLAREFPALPVLPVCADYTRPFVLPEPARSAPRAAFFPGSTIGNFTPAAAARFLRGVARLVGPGGLLLIGVDLRKDSARLEAAYNDAQGVTAAFNLNLLARINRELGADFDLSAFAHEAVFEEEAGRIVMRLRSLRDQVVRVAKSWIVFRAGESITTEYSYKFAPEEFARLAARAGFALRRTWIDREGLFSVHLLAAEGRPAG